MRKIQSRSEHEKKVRRNNFILGFVMVGLLVLSTAGYAIFSGGNSDDSGDVNSGFVKQGDKWLLRTQGEENLYFSYLPNETLEVEIDEGENFGVESYSSEPVYFVLKNGEDVEKDAEREILQNIGGFFLRSQRACLEGMNCEGDLPTKNCSSNIFVIDASASLSAVSSNESCVYIRGEVVRAADAYLYEIFGLR